MNTTQSDNTTIEDLLAAAGFAFAVIERCPDPLCATCTDDELAVAA